MCGPDTSEAGLLKKMLDEILLRPHVLRTSQVSHQCSSLMARMTRRSVPTGQPGAQIAPHGCPPDSIAADSAGFAATLSGIGLT